MSVDGGIINSVEFRPILANIIKCDIEMREMVEVTALGAALLAGLACGIYKDFDDIEQCVK